MNDTDRLLDLIAKKSKVITRVGTFAGISAGQALIDIDQSRFPAAFLTAYVPSVNEPVHVWSVDGSWFLLGPTTGRPGVGVVTTVGSGVVNVTTDFGEFSMPSVGTAPTSGQKVGISWPGPVCLGALSVQPASPTPPPTPGGGGATVKEATFRAIDAGSTDRGATRWWTAQPWASNSTYGAWFYGTQIKDTIPAGSQLVSMEMFINRVQDQGSSPNFALHTSPGKAGVPAMGSLFPWDPPNGWNPVPNNAWFAALIAGGSFYGVGLNQGGYSKFASLAQDGLSGALRIKWR